MTRHLSSSSRVQLSSRAPLLGLLGVALAACADPTPRELGFTQTTQDLSSPADDPFFQATADFAGHWVGQAEEPLALTEDGQTPTYRFPSGSGRIVLDLRDAAPDSNTIGSISFGSGEPLPPPTDPEAGYPVGVSYDVLTGYQAFNGDDSYYLSANYALPPFEGFVYDVELSGITVDVDDDGGEATSVADGVLSVSFSSNQPLDPWCQLQTSYPSPNGASMCVPDTGGQFELNPNGKGDMCNFWGPSDASSCDPDAFVPECVDIGEPVTQVNCDKAFLCTHDYCNCEGGSCRSSQTRERLTVRRVGQELIGVFEGAVFKNQRGLNISLGEVRFHRE